ncbi:hypothetical protein E8E13_007990 [Curvularia kusanoi]|uniref:RING-type domain-containing protein n=1 Tax=Curvularia kusanoi TaxID=90978 RepID=A0A9P4TD41_CURKU|nr:hypothetical protein E8E13_007990 [Curvularia kusanoi]
MLREIYHTLVQAWTGLPSLATFIDKHIVPGKRTDEFCNDQCGLCFGKYSKKHPRAKIATCGHIFGLGCVLELVRSPIGDTCPYCRTKLYHPEPNLALEAGLSAILHLLGRAFTAYFAAVRVVVSLLRQGLAFCVEAMPWLEVVLMFIFAAPGYPIAYVLNLLTDVGDRNYDLDWEANFLGSTFLGLMHLTVLLSPVLCPVYLIFGSFHFRWILLVLDITWSLPIQSSKWRQLIPLIDESDRTETLLATFDELSRAAILNARLASSALYIGSHRVFARLLEDRVFRLTEIGFEDLSSIVCKKELLVHMRSLALGCATFRSDIGINPSGFIYPLTFLRRLEYKDRRRLAATYMQCRQRQDIYPKTQARKLAYIFGALPKLESIRILSVDYPFHLGGWLEPGDEDLLHRKVELSSEGTGEMRLYNNRSSDFVHGIMEAIKDSGLNMRDFRIGPQAYESDNSLLAILTPSLHTLRIILSEDDATNLDSLNWSNLLGEATNLRDLSLGNKRMCTAHTFDPHYHRRWREHSYSLLINKPSGDLMLQALKDHKQLRRVKLHGGWAFSEDTLVNFAADHAQTLRCLILNEAFLFGSWQGALEAIARTTYGTDMLLKIKSPVQRRRYGNGGVAPMSPGQEVQQALLDFSYPVIWVTDTRYA